MWICRRWESKRLYLSRQDESLFYKDDRYTMIVETLGAEIAKTLVEKIAAVGLNGTGAWNGGTGTCSATIGVG